MAVGATVVSLALTGVAARCVLASAKDTRIGLTLVDVGLTHLTNKASVLAIAAEGVEQVAATASVQARIAGTLVNVLLAVLASEPRQAITVVKLKNKDNAMLYYQ